MSLSIKTNAAAPVGAPLFLPRLNRFTKVNLVSLQRFADATPAAAAADDVTGSLSAPTMSGGSVSALSGGGVRVIGNAAYPMVGAINITQPFTAMLAGKLLSSSTASGIASLLAVPTYGARGVNIYAELPGSPSGSSPVNGVFRQSIDGAQSSVGQVSLPAGSTWTLDRGFVLFLRHTGSGAGTVDVWCGGALIYSQAVTIDTTGVQGAIGSKSTSVKFGAGLSGNPTFIAQDMQVEALAVWSKALTSTEAAINYAAAAYYANARGRTWA